MVTKILAIDQSPELVMSFISKLALADVQITLVDRAPQAIKNVKKLAYDVILIGDRVLDGDTLDVGLALEGNKRNRKTPTVCLGYHKGRAARIVKLLGSSAIRSEPGTFDVAVAKIKSYLQKKEERSLV